MSFDLILRQARIAGREGELVDIAVGAGRIAAIETTIRAMAATSRWTAASSCPAWSRPTSTSTSPASWTAAASSPARCRRRSLRSPPPSAPSPRRTSSPAPGARWRRRSWPAPCACARMWRSIRASASRLPRHPPAGARLRLGDRSRDLRVSQEGLLNDPGTEELLVQACAEGADLIGGCPYTDTRAARAHRPHLRASLSASTSTSTSTSISISIASWMHLDEVCRHTIRTGTADASRPDTSPSCPLCRRRRLPRGQPLRGRCRRHGAAGHRSLPDGPRTRGQRSRGVAPATACASTASSARSPPTTF